MSNNSETGASFYKLLTDHDFTSQLRLPPQFVKYHGEHLPEKVRLFTESGNSWIVKTERIGRHCFLTDGWEKFAGEVDLKSSEFLLFKIIGKSRFEVSAYDTSGCQKELHSRGNEYEDLIVGTDVSGDGIKWKFVKKLTEGHTSELEIPRDFAVGTGIARNSKVKLGIGNGKKWPIHVAAKRWGQLAMTGGWNEFLTGNKVVVGSTIRFKFVGRTSGNVTVIAAKVVVRKGTNKGQLFSYAKRKRGRPPKLDGF